MEDRADALARIHDLLKPGGFFVSSTVCLGDSWVPYRPVLAVMRWLGKAPMVKIFSVQTLVDELRAAGFEDIEQPDVGAESTIAFLVARKPSQEPGARRAGGLASADQDSEHDRDHERDRDEGTRPGSRVRPGSRARSG